MIWMSPFGTDDLDDLEVAGGCEKRYAWPQIVEQLTDIYRRLIAEKAAGRSRPKK